MCYFQRFSELWKIVLFQETCSGAQSTDTGPNAHLNTSRRKIRYIDDEMLAKRRIMGLCKCIMHIMLFMGSVGSIVTYT